MTLVPWWCLLLHVMGFNGHVYRHGKSWNGYNFHTYPHPAKKPVIPRDIIVDVINNVGLKLLAIHNEYNENNIAISPYGALSVIIALGEGLEGDAVYEIQQATHIPSDISIIRVGLRDIHRHLKSYFIPKEGFLAGLTLNHENVTLRSEYEDILRFYGYDTATFNNALYPPPETSKIPQTTSEEITTTESSTTTEIGRNDAVEMTTNIARGSTISSETTTTPELSTEKTSTLPETTTIIMTTEQATLTIQQSTTTILPQTTEPQITEPTTVQMSTTAIESSTEKATTSELPTTVEVTVPSTVTSAALNVQESTSEAEITQPISTINEISTTEITSTLGAIPTSSVLPTSTVEPLEAGTTTDYTTIQRSELTTNLPTTLFTTTNLPTSSFTTTNLPTTIFTTTNLPTSLLTTINPPSTIFTTTNLPTSLFTTINIPTTMQSSTSLPSDVASDSTTPILLSTVTESVTTSDDVTLSTIRNGDTSTATPINTDTTTSLATDSTTINTTPNDSSTEKDNKDNEIDSTDSSMNDVGFGGISKRKVRSDVTKLNQTNVVQLNMRGSDFNFKRNSRSVVDYILARYYDDQFNFDNNPEPYIPEEQPSFLVYGKYKEYSINFMKYNTVLPFHYEPHLNALALSFPLDSTKYYLLLLLPVDETGIDKLICDLRLNGSLKYIIANLKYRHVVATIPSFMLKGYVTLTPSFQKLGIRKVFEPRQADFTPMTNQRGIYVTNIEQAITVNIRNYVDPSAIPNHRNLHRYDPVHFKADHPFLYFVIDSDIHVTLMAGKIVNPLNSRIS